MVVVVSFTMDITFTFVNVSKATQDYSGLLVLLRLWRVTRIINGSSSVCACVCVCVCVCVYVCVCVCVCCVSV